MITQLKRLALHTLILPVIGCMNAKSQPKTDPKQVEKTIYDFTVTDIEGKSVSLSDYKGKVVMVVNVASKCGLTPQYNDLEPFFEKYKDKGFVILGFPANDFMGQEPGSNEEIKQFCQLKYNVTFPMFSKISVVGKEKHPLYQYLTGATGEEVSWNFQKFVINREGKVVKSISPRTHVTDGEVVKLVESLL